MKRVRSLLLVVISTSCAAKVVAPRAEVVTNRPKASIAEATSRSTPVEGGIEVVVGGERLCVRIGHSQIECVSGEPTRADSWKPLRSQEALATFSETGAGTICAIVMRDGSVQCIGGNAWGELGAGVRGETSDEFVRAIGTSSLRSITAGHHHVCALGNDGLVRCWGRNSEGQTGSSTAYEQDTRELVKPSVVSLGSGGGPQLTRIAAGDNATCGIAASRDREVWCWGQISVLEDAGAHAVQTFKPTMIRGATNASDIAAGGESMCAVVNDGDAVVCWGVLERLATNPNPLLYHATHQAVRIEGLHDVAKIGVASTYGCVLHKNRAVSCWGRNTRGALGRGDDDFEEAGTADYIASTYAPRPRPLEPAAVKGLPANIRSIVVGHTMACALTDSDDVWCWGQWPHVHDDSDPYGTRVPIARRPKKLPLR